MMKLNLPLQSLGEHLRQPLNLSQMASKRILIALTVLLFAAITTLGYLSQTISTLQSKKMRYPESTPKMGLTIRQINPNGVTDFPKNVAIRFSQSVDVHNLIHFFSISPTILGDFSVEEESGEILFTPKSTFNKGIKYNITIAKGLTSKSGETLYEDFNSSFIIDRSSKLVEFKNSELSGRVLSFSTAKPSIIEVTGAINLAPDMHVDLYRSDPQKLLSSLIYVEQKVNPAYNQNYNAAYQNDFIQHPIQDRIGRIAGTGGDLSVTVDQPPGIYYLEARDAQEVAMGSVFIIRNSIGATYRQDDRQTFFSLFDLESNRALQSPYKVELYSTRSDSKIITTANLVGADDMPVTFGEKVDVALVYSGTQVMFVPVALRDSQADLRVYQDLSKATKLFLYTDRPIYKPGDTVFFRGLARVDEDALYKMAPSKTPIHIRAQSYSSNSQDVELITQTDEHGVFTGSFTVPENYKGSAGLSASTQPFSDTSYTPGTTSTNFDVERYTKPVFDLTTTVEEEEYLGHTPINFTISGAYFDGKPLAQQNVEYTIYSAPYFESEKAVYNSNFNISSFGGMCGGGFGDEWLGDTIETKSVQLDATGKTLVTFSLPPDQNLSQQVTLVAKRTDENGNEITSAINTIVHGADVNVFFPPAKTDYAPGEEVVIPFYAEARDGSKVTNQNFTWRTTITKYSNNKAYDETLLSSSTTTDSQGSSIVRFIPNEKMVNEGVSLYVESKDSFGNVVSNSRRLYVYAPTQSRYTYRYNSVSQTYLKIISRKNSFQVGETINLTVTSPSELDAYLSFERGRIYQPRLVHLAKGDTTISIPVTPALSPSATVVFSFFADGTYRSEGLSLNVPAMHKLLDVSVESSKAQYDPNETAYITVTTRNQYGNLVATQLSLAVVDRAIFALRKSATPPLHSSLYYFRNRDTNASSSLTWVGTYNDGGRGGGGGGGEGIGSKLVDTLYWNPLISSSGSVTVPVPLKGITTTWRAQVFASTDATDVGQGSTDFIAAQP